jgi:hypothetical protein
LRDHICDDSQKLDFRSLPVAGDRVFLNCMQAALSHTDRVRSQMTDKRYNVRVRAPERSTYVLIAASAEVHGEHLVFLNSEGQALFLFLLETVESCSVSEP